MSRRRFLYTGAMGAAALALTACSDDEPGTQPAAADTTAPGAETADTGADSTDTSVATTNNNTTTNTTNNAVDSTAAAAVPDCVLTPEDAEGPFYADLDLVRRDITDGRAGVPIDFRLRVVDAGSCAPLVGAMVDIWHADAGGLYSAFPEQGDDEDVDATDEAFLRGIQPTDDNGVAVFSSIYPGWYRGRTTHIHLKVHLDDRIAVTTQLYFPDDLTAEVYRAQPYADRGSKDTSNTEDSLGAADPALVMTVVEEGEGYGATHTLGVRPT